MHFTVGSGVCVGEDRRPLWGEGGERPWVGVTGPRRGVQAGQGGSVYTSLNMAQHPTERVKNNQEKESADGPATGSDWAL